MFLFSEQLGQSPKQDQAHDERLGGKAQTDSGNVGPVAFNQTLEEQCNQGAPHKNHKIYWRQSITVRQ